MAAVQPKATPLPANSKKRDSVIAQGKQLIGTPYLWGGSSPKGFDCSGLVQYLYKKHGISLPRSSRDQFASLPAINDPQPGDLVFFRRNGVINHVGIYLGNGNMLHSPQTGSNVRIESMEKPNWQRRYAGARRALPAQQVVAKAEKPASKTQTASKTTTQKTASKRVAKNESSKLNGLIPKQNTVR